MNIPSINLQIALENTMQDQQLLAEILKMFISEHQQDATNLQSAYLSQDYAEIKSITHTLKGVSASIGAEMLFTACKVLDESIKLEQMSNIEPQIAQVSILLKQLISELTAELD